VSRELAELAAARADRGLVHVMIDRDPTRPWTSLPDAELASRRTLDLSDVEGRSELRFLPERANGFRSGSPSHVLIDCAGRVRGRDVDRLALPGEIDRLLAER
jgi:hypothetical protein